ncbi:MAG: hypothetical protein QM731_25690 [Chitinophagaceae bacterium]
MAKQLGRFKFERTFDNVVFYRLGDKWYVRMKSSLSGRRVKTSKKFVKTMAYARRLGQGAVLAGAVYEKLPESWKMFELYQKLTGVAAQLLNEEKSVDDINNALEQQLYDWGYRKEIIYPDIEFKKKKIKLRTPRQCRKIEEMQMCGWKAEKRDTKLLNAKAVGKSERRKVRKRVSWQLAICSWQNSRNLRAASKYSSDHSRVNVIELGMAFIRAGDLSVAVALLPCPEGQGKHNEYNILSQPSLFTG